MAELSRYLSRLVRAWVALATARASWASSASGMVMGTGVLLGVVGWVSRGRPGRRPLGSARSSPGAKPAAIEATWAEKAVGPDAVEGVPEPLAGSAQHLPHADEPVDDGLDVLVCDAPDRRAEATGGEVGTDEHRVAESGDPVDPDLAAGQAEVRGLVLGAAVRAAGHVQAQGRVPLEAGRGEQAAARGRRGRDGEVAHRRAGAGPHVAGGVGTVERQADRVDRPAQVGHEAHGHVPEHQVLVAGEGEPAVAEAGQAGQVAQLVARQVPERDADRDHRQPGGALRAHGGRPAPIGHVPQHLGDVDVGQRGDRRGVVGGRRSPFVEPLEEGAAERRLPHRLHHELQAALLRVVEVTVGDEGLDERLTGGQHVAARHEREQGHGERGGHAEAAAGPQPVARLTPLDDRLEAGIVDAGVLGARRAAAEGHVDPARQDAVELDRPGHDRLRGGERVGPAVEGLVEADTGVRAGHHVAQRVAAGRAVRQPAGLDAGQHVGDRRGGDVVELDVLTGGEVDPAHAVRVDQVGHRERLHRRERAAGDADPDHEGVGLHLRAHPVRLRARSGPPA